MGKLELRPYQKEAVAKALTLECGFMLNEGMGKGKTITAITICNSLMQSHGYIRILVLCPANVVRTWQNNLDHFTGQEVVILSYSKYVHKNTILDYDEWDIIICDESHKLKNPYSKTGKKLLSLDKQYMILLTGTPLEKSYLDLYCQLRFIDDCKLGNFYKFKAKYCIVNHLKAITGFKLVHEIESEIKRLAFASDIKEIKPYKVEIKYHVVKLTSKQKALINELCITLQLLEPYTFVTSKIQRMMLTQRISTGKFSVPYYHIKKVKELSADKRTLILYNFTHEKEHLLSYLPDALEYSGKKKQLDEYLASNTQYLVAQISAIGEGTDGIQLVASNMIFFSLAWSYRLNVQAKARLDRIGQSKNVTIHYIVSNNITDKAVVKALKNKKSLSKKTLEIIQDKEVI